LLILLIGGFSGIFFLVDVGSAVMKKREKIYLHIKAKEVNSVLAYAASLVLTGIPPVVCESVISEVFLSVKRSISSILP
jgi:hypothetical protein